MFSVGMLEYDPSKRLQLAENLNVNAFFVLRIKAGESTGPGRYSEQRVQAELYLIRASGDEILMHGSGSGAAVGGMSPEDAIGKVYEKILSNPASKKSFAEAAKKDNP